MRTLSLVPVAAALALGLACTGEGDGDDAADATTPSIDLLRLTDDQLTVGQTTSLDGRFDFTDSDGDIATLHLVVTDPGGGTVVDQEGSLDLAGDTSGTATFSLPGFVADEAGAWGVRVWVVDAAGQRSNKLDTTFDAAPLSDGGDACAALDLDCTGEGVCYNLSDTSCAYLDEKGIDFDACDGLAAGTVEAVCVSSTTDPNSPLLTDDNRCTFVQYWSNPTRLPIDCRCPESQFTDECLRPYNIEPTVSIGDGPRMRDLASTVQAWRGVVVGREWLLPVMWSTAEHPDQTMIFGIDLDTGARRHVSGAYNDPRRGRSAVGAGDDLLQVMDLAVGPDDMLYAVGAASDIAAPKLWRIDPATGDRTKIFDADTARDDELCPNFSTLPGRKVAQMTPEGWAMDAEGRFYFSNVGMPGPSVLRLTIDDDGTRCEYLTRVTDCPTCSTQDNQGGGYTDIQFDLRAFSIHGDKLYAVSDTKLIEVDLATGDRAMLSNGKDLGGLGAGPINAEALGDRWTTWDPYREVLWSHGANGGSLAVVVDLASGDRTPWPCWHPTLGLQGACGNVGIPLVPGPLNYGGMVIDPQPPHDLFFAHDLMSVVKYDVSSGNAYIFSL